MKRYLPIFRLLTILCFLLLAKGLFAQDSLDLLLKLDKGLPPSGLNGSKLGEVVACIGDVNNDGFDDWAVGLPYAADYETGKAIGKIYLYFGVPSIQSNHDPDVVLEGSSDHYGTGGYVSAAGDVNKDGFDDFMVSINGHVALYYGGNPLNLSKCVLFSSTYSTGSYGSFTSRAGDVNKDGYDDMILNSDKGVCIFLGGTILDTNPDIILKGEQDRDGFGYAVSMAGDVNKDGFDDLIIGAPYYSMAGYEGRAYLYLGGAVMDTIADLVLTGEHADDYFGSNVSDAGDINMDGYDDVLVSAYNYQNADKDPGRVYIYFGGNTMDAAADVLINGTEGQSAGDLNKDGFSDLIINKSIYFGGNQMDNVADNSFPDITKFAGKGDYNKDGYADILTGQPTDYSKGEGTGSVAIYFGRSQLKQTADVSFYGEPAGDRFGNSVSGAGDVNNDGYDDFLISAPGTDIYTEVTGSVSVFFGGPVIKNAPDIVLPGKSGSMAGDVNGDGITDIIVNNPTANQANLYLGNSAIDSYPDYTFNASNPLAKFSSVASAGDFNNDGYDDLIMGDNQASLAGRAFLYLGGPGIDMDADLTFEGEHSLNYFGANVACAGDVNNDGFSDIMIGAPMYENSNRVGRLYIYFGSAKPDTIPDVVITGNKRFRELGEIISSAGDVNNDRYDDIMVSMPYEGNMGGGISYVNIYFGGAVMDTIADVKIETIEFGYASSIAGAGDINNDGYDDIIVGSIGKAHIFYGGPNMDPIPDLLMEGVGYWWKDRGSIVAFAGDINKDDHTDLLVGYPSSDAVGTFMGRVYVYSSQIINTGVEALKDIAMNQVYPNPFSSETTIKYRLQKPGKVMVTVFNTSGQEIETLVDAYQPSGEYKVTWHPKNLPGGIYFCQIQSPLGIETSKMIYQKGNGDF